MENDWIELKIDNLPPDILTGDYEFLSPCGGPESGILGTIGEMLDGEECFYRNRQTKLSSHEEIMTKWWKTNTNGEDKWVRVDVFVPGGKYEYETTDGAYCNKEWFTHGKSADIPSEVE